MERLEHLGCVVSGAIDHYDDFESGGWEILSEEGFERAANDMAAVVCGNNDRDIQRSVRHA
jgi:hypothetical protein